MFAAARPDCRLVTRLGERRLTPILRQTLCWTDFGAVGTSLHYVRMRSTLGEG